MTKKRMIIGYGLAVVLGVVIGVSAGGGGGGKPRTLTVVYYAKKRGEKLKAQAPEGTLKKLVHKAAPHAPTHVPLVAPTKTVTPAEWKAKFAGS